MKKILILTILIASLTSCTSKSGALVASKKKRVVDELFYSSSRNQLYPYSLGLQSVMIDTIYRAGDTVKTEGKYFVIIR